MSSRKKPSVTREDLIRESVRRANFLRDLDPQKLKQMTISYLQRVQERLPDGYDPVLLDYEIRLRRKSMPDSVSQPVYPIKRR